jgi:hypothetical protein
LVPLPNRIVRETMLSSWAKRGEAKIRAALASNECFILIPHRFQIGWCQLQCANSCEILLAVNAQDC